MNFPRQYDIIKKKGGIFTYDEKEIAKAISKKRKYFLVSLALNLFVFAGGVVFLAVDSDDRRFFSGIIMILISLVFIWNLCNKYAPFTLFSREIKGENIKEDIYEIYVRRGVALAPKQVGMGYGGRPLSHTRMAKTFLRSSVFLKLENGDIKEIRGMRVEHVELYEDGDTLLKYAGANYPIVLGRELERQPCPLCGTINLTKDDACIHCGLKIKH